MYTYRIPVVGRGKVLVLRSRDQKVSSRLSTLEQDALLLDCKTLESGILLHTNRREREREREI